MSKQQKSCQQILDIQRFNHLSSKLQFKYVKEALDFLATYVTPETFQHVYLSFNGGKDATVVLFLTLITLSNSKMSQKRVKCVYFSEPNSFQKIDNFIQYSKKTFNLQWNELKTKDYAKQLSQLSKQKSLKYIVMGTRKDDPHCQNLGKVAPSDTHKGYPSFLRINPIFEWSYEQVWAFIRGFNLPYCQLYNQGYTYLGNKSNTTKNQALLDKQNNKYHPAYEGHSQIQKGSRVENTKKEVTG